MDSEKVTRLVELKKQRTIVGDGGLPLIRGIEEAPMDMENVHEYRRFLDRNAEMQQELIQAMTPDEVRAADLQYLAWFRVYLKD